MSLRRKKILIPNGIKANLVNGVLLIEGKNGKLDLQIHNLVLVQIIDGFILVTPKISTLKKSKSLAGLICKEILNQIVGVQEKIEYRLNLVGVGYKAVVKENELELSLGFSHPNRLIIPHGISVTVEKNTEIIIQGLRKQEVGLLASKIRRLRPPEPYKGKGVLYHGEKIILKAGKSGKK